MSSKILVVGHRNPDNDSIAAAVGYAHLKNALAARDGEADAVEYVPARLGPLPVESAWILEQNDIAEPVLIENVNPVERDGEEVKQKVILVDHNEIGQAAPGIENAEVVEIIDHHRIADVSTANPILLFEPPHRLHGHHRHASVPPDRHRAARFHRPRAFVGHPHRHGHHEVAHLHPGGRRPG